MLGKFTVPKIENVKSILKHAYGTSEGFFLLPDSKELMKSGELKNFS